MTLDLRRRIHNDRTVHSDKTKPRPHRLIFDARAFLQLSRPSITTEPGREKTEVYTTLRLSSCVVYSHILCEGTAPTRKLCQDMLRSSSPPGRHAVKTTNI